MSMFFSLCQSLDEMLHKHKDNENVVVDVFVNQMRHSRWMNEQIIEVLTDVKFRKGPKHTEEAIKSLDQYIKFLHNDEQW